jgi:hypothetical protein
MHKHCFFIPMAASLVAIACQLDPKNIGTPDSTGELTGSNDTTANPTETSPGTNSDDSGVTDTSTTGVTDTTVGASDTSTAGDTDTTGDSTACLPADPATSAAFKVMLDGWPDETDDWHDVERTCTIDAVSSDGITVTTMLTCDVDGVPLGASFEIAAAPEGEVDWGVGQAVTLDSTSMDDPDFGDATYLSVTLSDDPMALLVHGQRWWGELVPGSQVIGPILRERTSSCDVDPLKDIEDVRYGLTYSLMLGASVSIMSGHRGALPIDATHTYAIDLAISGQNELHGGERSLIRRVKNG